jgi:hypothetical protein
MRSYSIYIIFLLLVMTSIACASAAPSGSENAQNRQDADSGAVSGASPEMPMQAASDAVSESGGESENLGGVEGSAGDENPRLIPTTGTISNDSRSPEDEMIPDGWPESVPIMEGFKVNIGSRNHSILTIVAYGDSTVDEVKDFYMNLPEWELQDDPETVETNGEDGGTVEEEIYIFNKGFEILKFKVFESEGQTVLNLMYEAQTPQE